MRPPRLIHLTLLVGALSATAERPASAGDHHKRSTRAYVILAEPTREYYVESAAPTREYIVEAAPARRVVEYRTVAPAARERDYAPEKYPLPEDFRYNPHSRDFDYAPAAAKGSPQARAAEPPAKEQPAPVVRERVIEREVPVVRERVIEREVPVVRERVIEREVPVVRERVVERAVPVRAIVVRDHCFGWLRP